MGSASNPRRERGELDDPSVARSARSIVPSPPSTTTRSASSSTVGTTSTPAERAHASARSSASPIRSGSPPVKTATRVTGRATLLGRGEIEEELTVSFRSWEARFDDSFEPPAPLWLLRGDLVEYPLPHIRVPNDASLAHVSPPCLELRLHEHERAPAISRAFQRRR